MVMLKSKLDKKNDVISDLIQITNSSHKDKICNKKDLPARENPLEQGISQQIWQAAQSCHDNS